MSTLNNGLILHLNFDEVADGTLTDVSGKGHVAKLQGNPQPEFDDKVGGCLVFDGVKDFVSLDDLNADYSKGLTVEAWVFYSSFNSWSRIIDFGNGPGSDNIFLTIEGESNLLGFRIFEGGTPHVLQAPGALDKLNVWMHIAATVDAGGSAKIYIDGKEAASGTLPRPRNVARANSYIGKSNWNDKLFQGKLGSLRIYNRALSAEEVRLDKTKDLTAAFTFRADNPLEFTLYDRESKQEAVYITDKPEGREVSFEVANASTQPITLAAPADKSKPGPDNHHFELRFRPGTLSAAALHNLKLFSPAGWSLHKPASDEAARNGRDVSLYLLSDVECKLEQGERLTLKLSGVSADLGVGGRGTRTEMKFRQTPDKKNLKSGARVRHLQVINHSGVKGVPLHAGFFGSNTVLNDGTSQNALTLRITNTSDKDLTLTPAQGGKASAPSKFIISFDVEANGNENDIKKEWALGTENQVNSIVIKDGGTSLERVAGKSEWILTNEQTSIPVGGYIELQLGEVKNDVVTGGIVTNHPSGPANVYIRYENIPGHWDGELIATIEKAPAVFHEDKVGIGTSKPAALLSIGGTGKYDRAGPQTWKSPDQFIFHRYADTNDGWNRLFDIAAIGCSNGSKGGGSIRLITSPADDKTNTGVERVRIRHDGNVGIGTTEPRQKLEVAGNIQLGVRSKLFYQGDPNPKHFGSLAFHTMDSGTTAIIIPCDKDGNYIDSTVRLGGIDSFDEHQVSLAVSNNVTISNNLSVTGNANFSGNVGIGTASPVSKLHVHGHLKNDGTGGIALDASDHDNPETNILRINPIVVGEFGVGYQFQTKSVFGGTQVPLTFDHLGRVGIGTPKSSLEAPLEVWGKKTLKLSNSPDGFSANTGFNSDGRGELGLGTEQGGNFDVSILAEGWVCGAGIVANSDCRIKEIVGPSDTRKDLEIIQKLRVTDYRPLDKMAEGTSLRKGFIGQEVFEILPQAVMSRRDVIPDIYSKAAGFAFDRNEKTLSITLPEAHDLTTGQAVRILTDETSKVVTVVAVPTPASFVVGEFEKEPEDVFVYGRQVDDFLSVDYDQIFTAAVGAIQEMKREKDEEVKLLRTEITELKSANDALQKRLALLESKFETAPGVVVAKNGSNGNGRH